MPTTIELDHRKPITLESALKKDANIISEAAYFEAATELYQSLWDQRQTIQALIKHYLKLSNQDTCIVSTKDQWIRGSFNVCILIEVRSTRCQKKLIFRCPMPHKLAEAQYPGTVDEKLSSKVGTYTWMQQHCPNIRIPHLYGFGFSDPYKWTELWVCGAYPHQRSSLASIRTAWRPYMNLHATAATRMLTIFRIVGRLKKSSEILQRVLEVI